jgi:hypothetical protein
MELVGSCRGLILKYCSGIRQERLRKSRKTSIRIAGRRGRESNPEPLEYEAGVLTLNSINQLIFVMVKCGVLFEVRAELLNDI